MRLRARVQSPGCSAGFINSFSTGVRISKAPNEVVDMLNQLLGSIFEFLFPTSTSADRQNRFRAEIWSLRKLLRTALGGGVEKDIVAALESLANKRDQAERAVVVWVDLIEVLVQTQERRYGDRPGMGTIKKAEVKEVVRYLLRDERFEIPHVPEFLAPVVVEIAADWTIDAVVLTANRYGLWKEREPSGGPLQSGLSALRSWLSTALRPVSLAVAWVVARIWDLLKPKIPLPPEVLFALKAVEREGLIVEEKELVSQFSNLMQWIGTHRKQLTAMVELLFAVVQEAESYVSLSGPEKKAYATDLVLAVLDELGFSERTGLIFALVDSMLSSGIEVAVHLFNKRAVFSHQ